MTKNLDKEGLSSIVDDYQLFYIDLWGVIHNGIKLHDEAINTLKQIQQREFNWKKDVNKTKTIGYIAQELETVYPAAVTTVSDESGQGVVAPDDDPDNPYKFVAKERLIDVLIKATQEQQTIIEELKARITTLEG